MFSLLRLTIWIAGIITVATFALGYFGFAINTGYFVEQKDQCMAIISECRDTFVQKGTEGVLSKCQWNCIDLRMLVRKQ